MKIFSFILFSVILFSCTQNKNNGYELFFVGDQYGLKKNGNTVITTSYQHLQIIESEKKTFVLAKKNNKSGLLDSIGNVLISCEYDSIYGVFNSTVFVMKNKLIGLSKLDGTTILPTEYESILSDSLGILILEKDHKYGIKLQTLDSLMDIIPFVCDKIEKNENFYIVLTKEKYGLIDNFGREIIPFNFDEIVEIGRIEEEQYFLFRVALNGKYGIFCNKRGNITEVVYDKIEPFENKIALIKLDNKWGYIGIRGEILLEPSYEELSQFNDEGDATYFEDGKKGIISRNNLFNKEQQNPSPEIEIQ